MKFIVLILIVQVLTFDQGFCNVYPSFLSKKHEWPIEQLRSIPLVVQTFNKGFRMTGNFSFSLYKL